jgi:hypothetical protein
MRLFGLSAVIIITARDITNADILSPSQKDPRESTRVPAALSRRDNSLPAITILPQRGAAQ